MGDCRFPMWEPKFQDAIRESDETQRGAKIIAAQKLILKRLGTMAFSPDTDEERYAILDALAAVREIQRVSSRRARAFDSLR